MKTNNNKNKIQQVKISKGYRLKPSTHRLIKKLQHSLNTTQDKIISIAIKLLQERKGF
jgi:hypothetical protein